MTTSRITLVAVAISVISSGSALATNRMSTGESEGCPNYESWNTATGSCPQPEALQGVCQSRVDDIYKPNGTCQVNEDGNSCSDHGEGGFYLVCNLQP